MTKNTKGNNECITQKKICKLKDLPEGECMKFIIDGGVFTLEMRYFALITWVIGMCSKSGAKFDDIPTCHSKGEDWALLQVELIYSNKSVKVLVNKSNLYLEAVTIKGVWHVCDKSNYVVESDDNSKYVTKGDRKKNVTTKSGRNTEIQLSYQSPSNDEVGLHPLTQVIKNLSDGYIDKLFQQSFETLCVHISEAARFPPILYKIIKSFSVGRKRGIEIGVPGQDEEYYDQQVKEQYREEVNEEFNLSGNGTVKIKKDIGRVAIVKQRINFGAKTKLPPNVANLMNMWSTLSGMWICYILLEKQHFELNPSDVARVRLKNVASMRSTLGIALFSDIDKALLKYSDQGKITEPVFEKARKKLEELRIACVISPKA